MGLDWMLYGRPAPGEEKAFRRLTKQINALSQGYRLSDDESARLKRLAEQREQIAISPWEEIGCPRVGRDAAAERWVAKIYRQRHVDPKDEWAKLSLAEVLEEFEGVYIEELVRDTAGIAFVQGPLSGMISFRGKVVGQAGAILGDELTEEAYFPHDAEECLVYAACIDQHLGEYLETHEELDEDQVFDVECLLEAVRWLSFWGQRGFGYEPWE